MEEIRIFRPALQNLKVKDATIAKEVICKKCKWSNQLFGMKADGKRPLTDGQSNRSKSTINEFHEVETTLKALGVKAWEEFPQESAI